jgi:hypothetical protein
MLQLVEARGGAVNVQSRLGEMTATRFHDRAVVPRGALVDFWSSIRWGPVNRLAMAVAEGLHEEAQPI